MSDHMDLVQDLIKAWHDYFELAQFNAQLAAE